MRRDSSSPLAILLLALLCVAGPSTPAPAAAWEPFEGGRSLAVSAGEPHAAGFASMAAADTGVHFSNHLARASAQANRLLEDGSGVAAGDIDGDGLCDLYFCRLNGPNALYRNLGGWKFADVTAGSGVECDGQFSTGAALADLDGDGDLDLLVNATGGGTRLFLNDGHGHFTESKNAGFATRTGARSIAIADVDGDGDLDVYVTHYRAATVKDSPVQVKVRQVNGQWQVPSEHRDRFVAEVNGAGNVGLLELGEPDALYLNDGHAVFAAVAWTGGRFLDEKGTPLTEAPKDWGLTAMFRDINRDGSPDLYVCNDFYTPDRIWINRGDGTFQALAREAMRKTSWASMAVDFADMNRDGHDDFFVAEMLSRELEQRQTHRSLSELDPMPGWGWGWRPGENLTRPQAMRNTLFLSRGDNTFAEIAQYSGVAASDWTWGVAFLDVDLDGHEDLLIANGHALDLADSDSVAKLNQVQDPNDPRRRTLIHELFAPMNVRKLAFRNRGDLTFEESGAAWGFNYTGAANGMILADLDNDGDLDVILNNFDAPAVLLQNLSSAPRLGVRLKGAAGNTRGVGARITVTGGPLAQSQEILSGGRYLSCDDAYRCFATGSPTNAINIEVQWRSGRRSRISGAQPNRVYEIEEPPLQNPLPARAEALAGQGPRLFEDVSGRVKHTHVDRVDDDGTTQPLLPRRLSQSSPGISWIDLNGDQHDDLVIPSGRGGSMAVFFGDGSGHFQSIRAPAWEAPAGVDQTMAVGWSPEPQSQVLAVAQASFCGTLITNSIARFNIWAGGIDPLPGIEGLDYTLGAIAAADVDGDGDIDLFVGGRALPGRYPVPAPSALYLNNAGKLVRAGGLPPEWNELGLVNSATWSDLDGDGLPELIVACEWGPIRVWQLRKGDWKELTADLGLADYRGWWNGVTTVDLDGDGRLDIVASNWGRNSKYQEFLPGEIRLFHGDFDDNGTPDVLEAVLDPRRNMVVPLRDRRTVLRALPYLNAFFPTYRDYAKASVADFFENKKITARELRANTLESMVFLNRGGRLIASPMPAQAQFAPAFGLAVADFDGDGNEDVFISQNFAAQDPETSRDDAGRGLLMRGDGTGRLVAVTGQDSGLVVYGEQRGCAVADFDEDGRPDLAVGVNSGTTRLFRNARGKPGLRVMVEGPPGNATAIGTKLRLGPAGDGPMGPVREIRAGEGYLSQSSAVQVLCTSGMAGRLWVQWPGGGESTFVLPPNTRQAIVSRGQPIRTDQR